MLPDPAWVQRSERLLEHTLLSLVGMDLETVRDADAEAELDLADLRELTSLFNSDWGDSTVRHNCCKRLGVKLVRLCMCEADAAQN